MKLRQLFNKIKDNTDYYSVEINGEKAIRPFTIIPDVEVEGELTKSNMLKILKDNGIIDNTTINTNEIVNKFLEAALEEQVVDTVLAKAQVTDVTVAYEEAVKPAAAPEVAEDASAE